MGKLREGMRAPAFTLSSSRGGAVSLSEFKGRRIVLYFYPKDQTPGCTVEACEFRDANRALAVQDAVVLGVSPDSAASHDAFIKTFNLPFVLLSDPDHTVAQAYGTWVKKWSPTGKPVAPSNAPRCGATSRPPAGAGTTNGAHGQGRGPMAGSMYGRTYMGMARSTFVIGPDGRIEKIYDKVKPAGHADQVVAFLRGDAETSPAAPGGRR